MCPSPLVLLFCLSVHLCVHDTSCLLLAFESSSSAYPDHGRGKEKSNIGTMIYTSMVTTIPPSWLSHHWVKLSCSSVDQVCVSAIKTKSVKVKKNATIYPLTFAVLLYKLSRSIVSSLVSVTAPSNCSGVQITLMITHKTYSPTHPLTSVFNASFLPRVSANSSRSCCTSVKCLLHSLISCMRRSSCLPCIVCQRVTLETLSLVHDNYM